MASPDKVKHLEFIQSVINRLSANSFLLKGWGATLVAALFALAAKDADAKFILVAYIPVLVFWVVDAYMLSRERAFRSLYNEVRQRSETEIDFSMDIARFNDEGNGWIHSFFSKTLLIYYGSLIGLMLLIMNFIR